MNRLTYWCDDGMGGGEWRANVRGTEVNGEEIDRLAAYEDTGMEPEEVYGLCEMDRRAKMADLVRLEEYQALGPIDRLRELAEAVKAGRIIVLPCKVGSDVYTIEEDYFNCEQCDYKSEAVYDKEHKCRMCDMKGRNCPYFAERHTVEGFCVGKDKYGGGLSAPGEWGYEGLDEFGGVDGKWYLTRKEAEAALLALEGAEKKEKS